MSYKVWQQSQKRNGFAIRKSLVAVLFMTLLLFGCSDPEISEKSAELSTQYDYYQKSVDLIKDNMDVSVDEADNIFIILTDCGIASEINYVFKQNDGTFEVWSAGNDYIVSVVDGAISTVYDEKDQLYPENIPYNHVMDYNLTVKDILNEDFDSSVIGQYAFIRVSNDHFSKITAEHLREFVENRVSGCSYNWISIIATNGTGICFPACNTLCGTYGELEKDGSVSKTLGTWTLQEDGNYLYTEIE